MNVQEKWREHELYKQDHVELVPIEWLWKYRGTDTSQVADLEDGRRVNLQELWSDIEQNGLFDPLIVRVGIKTRTCRLEAGNHRIQVLREHGEQEVPVTVQIQDDCGPNAPHPMNDGAHNFDVENVLKIQNLQRGYMKPSKVFKNI